MICPNCNHDHWEDVDWARFKDKDSKGNKIGMSVCTSCGFVSYPSKYKTKQEIIEHYRNNYRTAPTVNNMFTGERKNHFHFVFLKDLIEKWRDEKFNPKFLEIGAAFGMTLNLFQQLFPKSEFYGTEITPSYKNVAYHEFNLKLEDDFDDSKKYDLIISYKVLEHQLDPHIELKRYAKSLSENGFLYISVPTWFNSLTNFGLDGFDLEYYYDPNHVNVWTRPMFESLLKRCGLEIVKEDHKMYGDTYLCKASPQDVDHPVYVEDVKTIKENLKKIKDAFLNFVDQKFKEAIDLWPDYPEAHKSFIEINRKQLVDLGWDEFKNKFLDKAMQSCPNSVEMIIAATDFALRAKKFDLAIEFGRQASVLKPNNPVSIDQIATALEQMAIHSENESEKINLLTDARNMYLHLISVSTQNKFDAISKVYQLSAQIPQKA